MENEDLERILLRAAEFYENRITQIQTQKEREQYLKDIERSNQEFQAILELSSDLTYAYVCLDTGEYLAVIARCTRRSEIDPPRQRITVRN